MTNEQLLEIKQIHTEMLDAVEKGRNEQGTFNSELQEKFDRMNVRMDTIEISAQKAAQNIHVNGQLVKSFNPERKEAFEQFLRKGKEEMSQDQLKMIRSKEGLTPDQLKMLTEGDATGGGFFVVPEYVQEIIKSVILISPIRQYAKIRTTSTRSVKVPKRTGTFAATWTGEAQQQSEAKGLKYGMEEVPNHNLTAIQDISNEDLEDPMFDLSAEISSEVSEQFAKAEGTAFVNGNGKNQPEGFMGNSSVAYDPSTVSGAFTATGDEFVTCAHNLKSVYAANATWFLNRQTIGKVRLMKDSQGRPIWLPFAQSGLDGKNAPTIVGIPYAEVPDMDNVAANKFPVALGDWKRAYLIVDRLDIAMQRDPYSLGDFGAVRFRARKRVGGQLILSEAVRKIKIAVS